MVIGQGSINFAIILLEKAFFSTENCFKEQATVARYKETASLKIFKKESMLRRTKRRR
jgi:hypothetical protein